MIPPLSLSPVCWHKSCALLSYSVSSSCRSLSASLNIQLTATLMSLYGFAYVMTTTLFLLLAFYIMNQIIGEDLVLYVVALNKQLNSSGL